MAHIVLNISDPALRLALEEILQAANHVIVAENGEVTIADTPAAHADIPAPPLADTQETLASLAEAERIHVEKVLRACNGNQVNAARILGIGRNTLWRKLKSWNRPAADTRDVSL